MQPIIFVIHVLSALTLIGLVLIQHGKGADMGAAFGSGASQTVFGSQGSTPFLTKLTALIAGIFFVSCLALGYLNAQAANEAQSITTSLQLPTTESEKSKP